MEDIKRQIIKYTLYQIRSFRGASTNGKTHWNKCVKCQGDYFKENYCFIQVQ